MQSIENINSGEKQKTEPTPAIKDALEGIDKISYAENLSDMTEGEFSKEKKEIAGKRNENIRERLQKKEEERRVIAEKIMALSHWKEQSIDKIAKNLVLKGVFEVPQNIYSELEKIQGAPLEQNMKRGAVLDKFSQKITKNIKEDDFSDLYSDMEKRIEELKHNLRKVKKEIGEIESKFTVPVEKSD